MSNWSMHSQPSILQSLPITLPIPFSQLEQVFRSAPTHLQTEHSHNQLFSANHSQIQAHLQDLVHSCSNTIQLPLSTINPHQLVDAFASVFVRYPNNGNRYAQELQQWGHNNVSNISNINNFVYSLFDIIVHCHCENYQCSRASTFNNIINEQMNRLTQGTIEEAELERIKEIEERSSSLKQKLKASNLLIKSIGKVPAQKGAKVKQKLTQINTQQSNLDTFTSASLYVGLNFYQFHTLNHIFNTITMSHLQYVEQQYLSAAQDALMMAITEVQTQLNKCPQYGTTYEKLLSNLKYGLNAYQHYGGTGYYEVQSWMIVMVHIYKCTADNYHPYTRRILKLIFTSFSNQDLPNTIEVLRWLESHRVEVLSLEQDYERVEEEANGLLFTTHQNRHNLIPNHNSTNIPSLTLLPLSTNLPRRKTVNIWVSGFLSEDMSKEQQWGQLKAFMNDSQIYAVEWQSDSIKNLISFFGKACRQLVTASAFKKKLKEKFDDNIFNDAFEVAQYSGKYLAEIVSRLFPDQFINICGYSLGTQLIKQFMAHLIQIHKQHILSNVYMMGGVTDIEDLSAVVLKSSYPLCVYNCYTDRDMVLKHVLPMSKPNLNAIGLKQMPQIPGHEIINLDCSKFVSGHLSYMTNFQVLGKVIQMNEQ